MSEKILGLGYSYKIESNVNNSLIEMDFLALLFNHGIMGCIIYIVPICYFAVYCIKRIWKFRKLFWKRDNVIVYAYGILIGLACAVVAGHVLIAPAVSIYLAILIVKLVAGVNEYADILEDSAGNIRTDAN